ncbi:TetR/AcrR family transcriptional regulator [Rhodococcus qingshengii]|uniref:TetR/AcrR family transcriptional regulator n=1 Tax=Rhodococcus qingshengii TaxID=334542 RepID=UPI001BEAD084|nr:TetR/AcrR family transcriptional regulator [Rhodococcus qingshengii]MBT2275681.1 TetR/AcrR family transcriptional regulator [Rhodococcus qingshengii]
MTARTDLRMYGGKPVRDRRAERRAEFIAAGLTVFGEFGYARSSISALCAAAGLARSQFYEHFANREDLMLAVYDTLQTDAGNAVRQAVAAQPSTDVAVRARAAIGAYVASIGVDPHRAAVSFVQSVGISERVEQHRTERHRLWAVFFEEEARRALGDNTVPVGGYEYAATAFIGAVITVIQKWSNSQARPSIEVVTALLTRILIALLAEK